MRITATLPAIGATGGVPTRGRRLTTAQEVGLVAVDDYRRNCERIQYRSKHRFVSALRHQQETKVEWRIIVNPTVIGFVVFACTFGAALAGMRLRRILPQHHFSDESKDTVKLGIGLIATMTALILGLVTASAKSSFDDVSRALEVGESLFQTRSLIITGMGSSVPMPFLVMLLFWLTITFASFGLFAPQNPTVVSVLLLCTLSVAGAVFLVLEMDEPFQGLIRVSGDPLKFAVGRLNQ